MKSSEIIYLDKIKKYFSFIEECKNKLYDSNLVLHNHHIFPKFIYGKTKDTISLSVDDHVIAHLLLSECYEKDSREYILNLRSSRILNKNSIKDISVLKKISESYFGEKNPFYGKSHTDEVKEILSKKTKILWKNISYEERYGSKAKIEKNKRSIGVKNYWDKIDPDLKKIRSNKIKNALIGNMIGDKNPMSKKVEVNGVVYGSLSQASKKLGKTTYFIKKEKTFKYL